MNKTMHCVTLRMCDLGSKGDSSAGDLMGVPALPGLTSCPGVSRHPFLTMAHATRLTAMVKWRRKDRQSGLVCKPESTQ